ncbi:hypothetical protein AVEN_255794-1 [Araneus ventricosus]|uniref:Uncharacterized protein n=1 Tax=Araneus ventricosus TaxID=182803 RepID=A0A4Y2WDT0_ARAVE|nr:hypothetical protein AVEN_255794-1 [Araneus ventricosus]
MACLIGLASREIDHKIVDGTLTPVRFCNYTHLKRLNRCGNSKSFTGNHVEPTLAMGFSSTAHGCLGKQTSRTDATGLQWHSFHSDVPVM